MMRTSIALLALFLFIECNPAVLVVTAFSTTTTPAATATANNAWQSPSAWEEELCEISQPLDVARAGISESLDVLKRDGVVRLNPTFFRVDEKLCAALRDRLLSEINSPFNDKGDQVDKTYVPGTRIRPGRGAIDLAFGGDARHDVLLPLNDENFSELRPVLESAARQLEPLLLEAADEILPRLHGRSDACENDLSDVELVEVGSLVVRQGSGHQGIHGDYRRFHEENNNIRGSQREESFANTKARSGKLPPRLVTFVALQDIPTKEHGATGFVTGTHTSYAHEIIYGESDNKDDDELVTKARKMVLQSSTSGVRTSSGIRRGEMLIYDASVLHWGGANSIPNNDRALLYFGISPPGAAALLGQHQPPLKGFEIVAPIVLRDVVTSPQ